MTQLDINKETYEKFALYPTDKSKKWYLGTDERRCGDGFKTLEVCLLTLKEFMDTTQKYLAEEANLGPDILGALKVKVGERAATLVLETPTAYQTTVGCAISPEDWELMVNAMGFAFLESYEHGQHSRSKFFDTLARS